MNSVKLRGYLVKNPEFKATDNGGWSRAMMAVAGYGKSNEMIPLKAYGPIAEAFADNFKKDDYITVVGRLATDHYEKDGKTVYTWEVVIERVTE